MKNLILISFLFFVLSGCHISLFHSYHRVKDNTPVLNLDSYFSNPDSNYLYQADIQFMKNYYSGIVAIKPRGDSAHRVVFITEMGIKVFDYEIRNPFQNKDYYKVNYMMEPLSKKIIQKTLAKDFSLLLQDANHSSKKIFADRKNQQIAKITHNGLRFFYIFGKDSKMYNRILIKSALFKKAEVDFWANENFLPDSMKINHYGIKLKYAFGKLKQ